MWKTPDIYTGISHWVGKWDCISPSREGYFKGISLCGNTIPNKSLKTNCWKDWERTGFQEGRDTEKIKEKAAAAQIRNSYIVFNYLLVLHFEQGLFFFFKWKTFAIGLKTRKGFSVFWSNKSEYSFPYENYTAAFKDAFPDMFYFSHNCQQNPQQCSNPTLLVLFYSLLTYCVGGDSTPVQTQALCI